MGESDDLMLVKALHHISECLQFKKGKSLFKKINLKFNVFKKFCSINFYQNINYKTNKNPNNLEPYFLKIKMHSNFKSCKSFKQPCGKQIFFSSDLLTNNLVF